MLDSDPGGNYACGAGCHLRFCFGVELTMNNIVAGYPFDQFDLDHPSRGLWHRATAHEPLCPLLEVRPDVASRFACVAPLVPLACDLGGYPLHLHGPR